jgi:hypothetical protein
MVKVLGNNAEGLAVGQMDRRIGNAARKRDVNTYQVSFMIFIFPITTQ